MSLRDRSTEDVTPTLLGQEPLREPKAFGLTGRCVAGDPAVSERRALPVIAKPPAYVNAHEAAAGPLPKTARCQRRVEYSALPALSTSQAPKHYDDFRAVISADAT